MNNFCQLIQKKDIVECATLLGVSMAALISFFCGHAFIAYLLLFLYSIFMLVIHIKHFYDYSILNKDGRPSFGLYFLAIYAKLESTGLAIISMSIPKHLSSLVISLIFTLLPILAYTIVVLCKKAWKELFNTIIYIIPILVGLVLIFTK